MAVKMSQLLEEGLLKMGKYKLYKLQAKMSFALRQTKVLHHLVNEKKDFLWYVVKTKTMGIFMSSLLKKVSAQLC